jgi:hypothetical protein
MWCLVLQVLCKLSINWISIESLNSLIFNATLSKSSGSLELMSIKTLDFNDV